MLIIDRFEGDLAVCEAEDQQLCIPRGCLPEEAREGDALTTLPDGSYGIDAEATARRRARAAARVLALAARTFEE